MTRRVKVLRCPNGKCRGAAMAEVVAQPEGLFLHTTGSERVGHLGTIETMLSKLPGSSARHFTSRSISLKPSVKKILTTAPEIDWSDFESIPLDATWPGQTEPVACRRCHSATRVAILPGGDVVLESSA